MPRPPKNIALVQSHASKDEIEKRTLVENKIKGSDNKLTAPKHLSKAQKNIYNSIVNELKTSGILGNLDTYILETCAISIDRLQEIERIINEDIQMMFDRQLLSAKDKYSKEFFKCCTELCLSPQSRAKIGTLNVLKQDNDTDPLLKILNGE